MLGMQAALLAVAAYRFANAVEGPGRRLHPAERHEFAGEHRPGVAL
jgi:hypothetical protein